LLPNQKNKRRKIKILILPRELWFLSQRIRKNVQLFRSLRRFEQTRSTSFLPLSPCPCGDDDGGDVVRWRNVFNHKKFEHKIKIKRWTRLRVNSLMCTRLRSGRDMPPLGKRKHAEKRRNKEHRQIESRVVVLLWVAQWFVSESDWQ
jgi:hypothetical protein